MSSFILQVSSWWQGRNKATWRPEQETSMAPHVRTWGLSEGNELLKKVLVTLLGLLGVPAVIRRPWGFAPLVAPLHGDTANIFHESKPNFRRQGWTFLLLKKLGFLFFLIVQNFFSRRHFGHLSHSCIKTHRSSAH